MAEAEIDTRTPLFPAPLASVKHAHVSGMDAYNTLVAEAEARSESGATDAR